LPAIIGESPTWFAPERALYWKDAFFLSHSHAGEVLRAPYDRASGSLGKPSPFAEIRTGGHVPDGAAGTRMAASGARFTAAGFSIATIRRAA
jgi:sugar lactone lactonase YvrE